MTSIFYNCSLCEYKSNKKFNLNRHMVAKHNKENIITYCSNPIIDCSNPIIDCSNPIIDCSNPIIDCSKHIIDNKCIKCNKILSSKRNLEKHLLICKGVSNPLECHLCHKILANSSSKSRHLKICKVKLSLIDDEKPSIPINSIINNNITNNITNNIDNSINTSNITNIIVFNPNNPNGKSLKTDHINLEFINKLIKIKEEEDAFSLYTKKILDNPENRCIKKTNLRSTFSEIHVGDNKWNSYYDSDIYPKFISEISNCLCELLVDKISTKKIINKLIEFLDYMSDNGYCNNDDIKNIINKKHKELIQRIKAIVYNVRNFI